MFPITGYTGTDCLGLSDFLNNKSFSCNAFAGLEEVIAQILNSITQKMYILSEYFN